MIEPPDENLKTLVSEWAFRRGREASAGAFLANPQLPESCLEQITRVEPFRAQAIEDALVYYSMPHAIGFGMELFFPESFDVAAFENWSETIHGVTAQMEFRDHFDGDDYTAYQVRLERIGREDGAWRIIEVFGADERAQMQTILRAMKEFFSANKEI